MSNPLLQWRDEYLVGVEELDFEHKDLFERLNELHENLANHDEKAKIEDCLGEIHTRVLAHFALEERFMLDTKFPNYERHKKEHDDFLEVIADIIERFRTSSELSYGEALEEQLQHWILYHITTSDQELGSLK
jgi:hemerythrin